ncbi:putative ester cyclase [Fuerstiella marisgermanici]|uniref:Putative ester cyclase n=2 Tax=Fuerstiella marisgermanici TaxID=1891926 RepID=A0A1P8WA13_9PLAN|nr:putative ester cyclase [Fuerstiella marisgermanici]
MPRHFTDASDMMTDPDSVFRSGSVRVDGRRLKEIRHALGWTQQVAANKSGYTDRLIRKLERGGPVATDTLKDILDTYRESQPQGSQPRLPQSDQLVVRYSNPQVEGLTRSWFKRAFNKRDLSVIDDLMHERVLLYAEGSTLRGRAPIRQRISAIHMAFNPLELTVENVLVDGNSAVAYWSVRKKHVAEFLGIPATHRWVSLKGSSLAVFRDRQIVEARDHWDVQHLVEQLTG